MFSMFSNAVCRAPFCAGVTARWLTEHLSAQVLLYDGLQSTFLRRCYCTMTYRTPFCAGVTVRWLTEHRSDTGVTGAHGCAVV
jgi:hypothetical protein